MSKYTLVYGRPDSYHSYYDHNHNNYTLHYSHNNHLGDINDKVLMMLIVDYLEDNVSITAGNLGQLEYSKGS